MLTVPEMVPLTITFESFDKETVPCWCPNISSVCSDLISNVPRRVPSSLNAPEITWTVPSCVPTSSKSLSIYVCGTFFPSM